MFSGEVIALFAVIIVGLLYAQLHFNQERLARRDMRLTYAILLALPIAAMVVLVVFANSPASRIGMVATLTVLLLNVRTFRVWYIAAFKSLNTWTFADALFVIRYYARNDYQVRVQMLYPTIGEVESPGDMLPNLELFIAPLRHGRPDKKRAVSLIRRFESGEVWYFWLLIAGIAPDGPTILRYALPKPETHNYLVTHGVGLGKGAHYKVRTVIKNGASPVRLDPETMSWPW